MEIKRKMYLLGFFYIYFKASGLLKNGEKSIRKYDFWFYFEIAFFWKGTKKNLPASVTSADFWFTEIERSVGVGRFGRRRRPISGWWTWSYPGLSKRTCGHGNERWQITPGLERRYLEWKLQMTKRKPKPHYERLGIPVSKQLNLFPKHHRTSSSILLSR